MSQFIVLDGDGKICPIYKGEEMNPYEILTADEVRKIVGTGRSIRVFELVAVRLDYWKSNEDGDANPEPPSDGRPAWPLR